MARFIARILDYLPSKKFTSTVVSLLLVGGGFLFFTKSSPPSSPDAQKSARAQILYESQDANSYRGAEDWQKTLQKTSIADNAEDGTPQEQSMDLRPTKTILENLTLAIQSRAEIGTSTREAIIQHAAPDIALLKTRYTIYDTPDVLVQSNASPKEYLNAIGDIMKRYFPDDPKDPQYTNEIFIISRAVANKEIENLDEGLQKYIYRYAAAADALKKISAPPDAVTIHLALLNSFANTAEALREIAQYPYDPIVGTVGMTAYGQEISKSTSLFTEIKKFAESHAVTFARGESGYELQIYFDKI